MANDLGQLGSDQFLERPAWHAQYMTQVNHRQPRPSIRLPPLPSHRIGLAPANSQQLPGLLDRQQDRNPII